MLFGVGVGVGVWVGGGPNPNPLKDFLMILDYTIFFNLNSIIKIDAFLTNGFINKMFYILKLIIKS